mmetsp:Transcript_23867/g.54331  ORF Transcript_23867/g.54331 Transcript_23867/m.54331 type:complete len:336 (+) Transcript_23867:2-1009(+)
MLSCLSMSTRDAPRGQVRAASHAGSWYSDDPGRLRAELDGYLAKAQLTAQRGAKALICPHAGYRYAGPTAAWSFKNIPQAGVSRVFILGPSHHVHFRNTCALPQGTTHYETPFGPLILDQGVLNDLRQARGAQGEQLFVALNNSQDEDEHSVEMQLPFLKMMMGEQNFTVVPVVVGSLSEGAEQAFGSVFAPYFEDPATIFLISSDFCHWGSRFRYTHLPDDRDVAAAAGKLVNRPEAAPLNAKIETLDRQGMELIEAQDSPGFRRYLENCQNTICGRNPIAILLEILRQRPQMFPSCPQLRCEFVHYSQSQTMPTRPSANDSCVSYAAGVIQVA